MRHKLVPYRVESLRDSLVVEFKQAPIFIGSEAPDVWDCAFCGTSLIVGLSEASLDRMFGGRRIRLLKCPHCGGHSVAPGRSAESGTFGIANDHLND
jgi:hypothetical protein